MRFMMTAESDLPVRTQLRLELTSDGYLRIAAEDAEHFFPDDVLVALWRDESLLLIPTRGAAAGGLMLKQRNAAGDRSLLIAEVFGFRVTAGRYTAVWDESIGGLRLVLPRASESEPAAPAGSWVEGDPHA